MSWTARDTIVLFAMILVAMAAGVAAQAELSLSRPLSLAITLASLGAMAALHLTSRRLGCLTQRVDELAASLQSARAQSFGVTTTIPGGAVPQYFAPAVAAPTAGQFVPAAQAPGASMPIASASDAALSGEPAAHAPAAHVPAAQMASDGQPLAPTGHDQAMHDQVMDDGQSLASDGPSATDEATQKSGSLLARAGTLFGRRTSTPPKAEPEAAPAHTADVPTTDPSGAAPHAGAMPEADAAIASQASHPDQSSGTDAHTEAPSHQPDNSIAARLSRAAGSKAQAVDAAAERARARFSRIAAAPRGAATARSSGGSDIVDEQVLREASAGVRHAMSASQDTAMTNAMSPTAGAHPAAPQGQDGPGASTPDQTGSRSDLIASVEAAARSGRVELYLEPILRLPDRNVLHFQIIPRLRVADDSPALLQSEFIDVARARDVLKLVDKASIARTVQILKRLTANGQHHLMFIRLADRSSLDVPFLQELRGFLATNPEPASRLVLEVDADRVRRASEQAVEALAAVQSTGARLSLCGNMNIDEAVSLAAAYRVNFLRLGPEALRLLSHRGGPARVKQWMLDARTRGVEVIVTDVEDDRGLSIALESGASLAHGALFAEPKPLVPQRSGAAPGEADAQPGPNASADGVAASQPGNGPSPAQSRSQSAA